MRSKCNYVLRRAESVCVLTQNTRSVALSRSVIDLVTGNSAVWRWNNFEFGREEAYGSARRVNAPGIMRSDAAHVNAVINARRWRFLGSNAPNADAVETSKSDGRTDDDTDRVRKTTSPGFKHYPSLTVAFYQDQGTTNVFRIVLKSTNVSNTGNMSSGEPLCFSQGALTFFNFEI